MTKRTRRSEIRVTGPDGETHTGTGASMALAARDLGAQHAEETRYTLTEQGASYLAGMRTQEYLDDPSLEGAARMEAAYQLAERLGYWERGS